MRASFWGSVGHDLIGWMTLYIYLVVYVEVLFFKIYFYLFSLQLAVWLMAYYLSILFSCEALTFLQIENLKNKLQQYQITLSQNSMIRILFQNLSQRQQKNRKRAIKLKRKYKHFCWAMWFSPISITFPFYFTRKKVSN